MQATKSNQLTQKRRVNKNASILRMQKIDFDKDAMNIYLEGDRVLSIPLKKFPEIRKLNKEQRKKYNIAAGISLDFDDSDEVYHINELIGIDVN